MSAFKSSPAGVLNSLQKKPQTPKGAQAVLTANLLSGLRKPNTAGSETDAGKKRSLRTDRISDYVKNNFFVKNNYFGAKADSAQKTGQVNKTADAVMR